MDTLLLRSDSVFSFIGKIGQFSFCLTFFVNLRQISKMEREYKSKVGWWYHLVIIMVVIGCVAAFLRTNISAIVGMMVAALGVLHVFFNTYYRITEDDMLIAHCSIFPEKKIAIADIEALESTVMPVSSYALSLDRLIIWSNGKPWMLISPTNRADFIKQLRKINPNIQLK